MGHGFHGYVTVITKWYIHQPPAPQPLIAASALRPQHDDPFFVFQRFQSERSTVTDHRDGDRSLQKSTAAACAIITRYHLYIYIYIYLYLDTTHMYTIDV